MYKTQRRMALISINVVAAFVFIVIAVNLAPQTKLTDYKTYSNLFPIVVTVLLFAFLLFTSITLFENARGLIEKISMESGATAFLTKFIGRLRFCYSLDDFTSAVSEILEIEAGCSILYVDRNASYVLYSSPDKFTNDPKILTKLEQNYSAEWQSPINFIGDSLGLVTNLKKARGFFFSSDGEHLYVFNRYTYLFDMEIYEKLYERKVVDTVRAKVKVVEKAVSADEFAALAREL